MYSVRLFCTRHAQGFAKFYSVFEGIFARLHPVLSAIGYGRLEKPVAFIEKVSKGFLFDCQMCGQCVLSSTGMACPMNCPKNLRNGPCGGVRDGGFCEVIPNQRCVWVEAWDGAEKMTGGLEKIRVVQPPVNHELAGSSSWLRVLRERAAMKEKLKQNIDQAKVEMASTFSDARKLNPTSAPMAPEPDAALAEQAVAESTSIFDSKGTKKK